MIRAMIQKLVGAIWWIILFAVLWAILIIGNIYSLTRVVGDDMEPFIAKDSMKVTHSSNEMTTLTPPDTIAIIAIGEKRVTGRIIAKEGDTVKIKENKVFVNGKQLQESYASASVTEGNVEEIVIPKDHVYILCDNRRVGLYKDSRAMGPIGRWAIIGVLK